MVPQPQPVMGTAPYRAACMAASLEMSGRKTTSRAPQWERIASTSRAVRRAFTFTIQASSEASANSNATIAAQFSPTMTTRSPARTPASSSSAASASRASSSAAQVRTPLSSCSAMASPRSPAQWRGMSSSLSIAAMIAGRGAALALAGELRGEPDVGRGRELEQALAVGLGNRERADECVEVVARDAALAARELLQLLVRVRHPVRAHHGLHRLGEHVPRALEVGSDARGVGLQLLQALEARVVAQQRVAERHAHVAQHGRVREVALPA